MKERGDPLKFGDVLVVPDAEVAGRDAGFGADGVGFGDDEGGAANGAAAEMDEVPVVGEAVDGGVFAHGRDGDAVGEGKAAELERGEEMVGWLGHRGLDVAGGDLALRVSVFVVQPQADGT
jgi:hypothetical protein